MRVACAGEFSYAARRTGGGTVAGVVGNPRWRSLLLLDANRGIAFVLDASQAKEFALAHLLTVGASGGRLFVRVFDGARNVRVDIAGDVLASITTMQWNGPAKGWNAGAPMDDANFNRRQTIRVGAAVSYAQVGVIGFDGPIDLQSLRLYGCRRRHPRC